MFLVQTSFSYVVDCVWGSYGEWSTCFCGRTRVRTRTEDTAAANGGAACTGSATETKPCEERTCPGNEILKFVLK